MKRSIRNKYLLIQISIVAAVIICCLVAINVLLEPYYINRQQKKLIQVYTELSVRLFPEGEAEIDEDTERYLQTLRESTGIETFLWNSSQKVVYSSINRKGGIGGDMILNYILGPAEGREILEETEDYELGRNMDDLTGNGYLEMFAHFPEGSFAILRCPLESIHQTVALVNRFIIYVSLAIAVLGILAASLLTRNMTAPIRKLSQLAERMADLDFTAHYEGVDYEEFQVLGNSMNHMSDQLEKTILELKNANLELRKDIDRKTKEEEMRREFLAGVSHELKTPIALIQGYAEGLKEGISEDPEDRAFYCEVIADEALKMNQMVSRMLTLNQIEESSDQVELRHFDLIELIRQLLNSYKLMIRQKEALVDLYSPESLMIYADEYMAEEVLRNYIGNAFHYLEGDKKLQITVTRVGEKAHVEVFNSGKTIPEEALERLWDKFYKVDKARTREYGGNGLGLSIVKAAMETLGGAYGVRNEKDGVVFWCDFDCR